MEEKEQKLKAKMNVNGTVKCGNAEFGDPVEGARKSATVNINHVCRSHRVTSALKKEKTTIFATARARFIMEHGVQSKWILIRK